MQTQVRMAPPETGRKKTAQGKEAIRPRSRFRSLIGRRARLRLPNLASLIETFLRRLVYATPLYSLSLMGRAPTAMAVTPPDPWPGDAARGRAILESEFTFAGESVFGDDSLWSPPDAGDFWMEELHGFSWISDLHMVGSDAARLRTRALVADWIAPHKRWSPVAWRGDVLGTRIAAWLGRYDFFCASADEVFREKFFASLNRQVKHLARTATREADGARRFFAIKGLIYAGVCLPNGKGMLAKGVRFLEQEIKCQILADGCHYERSPRLQLVLLRLFIDIRATLIAGKQEVPTTLQSAIDRMAPMLRFFRHGDGGLALFNDSTESESWLVDMVLTRADAKGKPLSTAPHSGFQRLHLNRSLVILDAGPPTLSASDEHAHAGTLSFEMSVGKERMIVNCGAYTGSNENWRYTCRTSAAHSTLVLEDTNSTEILTNGHLNVDDMTVTSRRDENDGNIWIEASHDGYEHLYGVVHRRRLYLASGSEDFRGEDSLIRTSPRHDTEPQDRFFILRFHLHPQVRASLLHNRAAVLLRLPSGQGWRLRASGGELGINESVYLGISGEIKRCEQITISAQMAGGDDGAETTVKWALSRVDDT